MLGQERLAGVCSPWHSAPGTEEAGTRQQQGNLSLVHQPQALGSQCQVWGTRGSRVLALRRRQGRCASCTWANLSSGPRNESLAAPSTAATARTGWSPLQSPTPRGTAQHLRCTTSPRRAPRALVLWDSPGAREAGCLLTPSEVGSPCLPAALLFPQLHSGSSSSCVLRLPELGVALDLQVGSCGLWWPVTPSTADGQSSRVPSLTPPHSGTPGAPARLQPLMERWAGKCSQQHPSPCPWG